VRAALLAVVVAAIATGGCGRIGFDPEIDGGVGALAVVAPYPAHGSNWLDYVVNDGSGVTSASGAPCTGTELGYTACIHGGEVREVAVPGVSSCAGLAATDALAAFAWTCEVRDGRAVMFSALADGKGLTDLITPMGWRSNHVTVTGTGSSQSTADAVWWTNPIEPLPNNAGAGVLVLEGYPAGTIFTVASSFASPGYNVDQDKLAIVVMPGAILSAGSADSSINYQTGKIAMANHATVLGAGFESFLWFEGEYNGTYVPPAAYVACVIAAGVSFMHLNLFTCDGPYDGLDLTAGAFSNYLSHVFTVGASAGDDGTWVDTGSTYNSFYDFTAMTHDDSGIHFDTNCGHNTLEKIRIYDSGQEGLTMLSGADGNSIDDVVVSNVATDAYDGAVYVASNSNTFSRMLVVSTDTVAARYPIFVNGGDGNVFNQVTVANNVAAVYLSSATNTTVNQLVVTSSGSDGIDIINGGSNVLSQIVVSHSTAADLNLDTTSNNRFPGNLLHDGMCTVTGGTDPGLITGTCAKENTADLPATIPGVDASTMLGVAVASDADNQSASSGMASFPAAPSTFDWWRFVSPYRSWAPETGLGRWVSGLGQILDYRFIAGAALLGTSGQGLDGQTAGAANAAFVAGAACPSSASAGALDAGGTMYLLDAVEIVDPRAPGYTTAGNHNGLCNTGEACVYLPNFGVDQGQETGASGLATCVYDAGSSGVSGVTMYGYP
jgi:hypothetical protein